MQGIVTLYLDIRGKVSREKGKLVKSGLIMYFNFDGNGKGKCLPYLHDQFSGICIGGRKSCQGASA